MVGSIAAAFSLFMGSTIISRPYRDFATANVHYGSAARLDFIETPTK
jgi:hypothetical protein